MADTGDLAEDRRPRPRDAAATRQALLVAARDLVARHGVEGTSTRDVAAEAGVNQALVYRYFGSKEKLFTEAIGGVSTEGGIIAETPLSELPRVLLGKALDRTAAEGEATNLSVLVTAANDDTIREIIRERIEGAFSDRLADRLGAPDAALRAELLAALLTGIGFLRSKIGTEAIVNADRETLGAYVDRMVAPLLDD